MSQTTAVHMKKKRVRKPKRKPNHECDQIDVFCEEFGSLNVHQNVCSKFVERNEEMMDETEGMYFDVFCEECGSLNTHQNDCLKFVERNEEMDETEGMYFDVFCEECGSLNTHQNYCSKLLEHLVENVEFIQDDNNGVCQC